MADTALYIYCLVERARRPSLTKVPSGLPGASTPEMIEVGASLWAATCEVPLASYGPDQLEAHLRDVAWVSDMALAHEAVVEALASQAGASVVPMKLFTMFSSRDRAVADLRARRKEVAAVLSRIRGCVEWGIRITRRPPTARSRAKVSPIRQTGAAFLAAKKRLRDEVRADALRAAEAAEDAYEALAALAKAAERRPPPEGATTPPLVDAALLVPTKSRTRFRAAVSKQAAACRKAGAELTLTGPWPAYNFVQSSSGLP
jgi:hypothetical protein